MKLFAKTAIVGLMVLGTVGAANAATLDKIPGISSTNLNVSVKDGVATLFGNTESASERQLAERHVAKLEGVDKVINLVTFQ